MKKLLLILLLYPFFTKAQFITTVVGNGIHGNGGDGGPAISAEINNANNVAFDVAGNMYISDLGNYRVRKVSVTGVISTIAGNGIPTTSGDGGPATLSQLDPVYVTTDKIGNVYVADYDFNHRIRKIDTSGVITTIAGTGVNGFSGDGGPATAAKVSYVTGLAVDTAGNIYLADHDNWRIRKINTLGIISTVAGNGIEGWSGDGGPVTAATIVPTGIGVDGFGNIYFADDENFIVRKVSSSGIITRVAGNATSGFSGDGGAATAAQLKNPSDVTFDNSGNIYITDYNNNRIRKVDTAGIITTVAGGGISGLGDGGSATAANLYNPTSATYFAGSLYISDIGHFRIRRVDGPLQPIDGVGTICEGSTIHLSNATAGGIWTSSNSSVAIVDSVTGIVTGALSGIDTITYAVSSYIATCVVTVNPLPTAITGETEICIGSSTILTETDTGGIWYSYDYPIAIIDPYSGILVGETSGIDTILYLSPTGCIGIVGTITVNPMPSEITGIISVCAGDTTSVVNDSLGGFWSSGDIAIASIGLSSGLITGISSGITAITYSLPTGCAATALLTVNALPLTASISTICVGSTSLLTDTVGIWNSSDSSIAIMGASTTSVTGISSGIANITYTLPTGCKTTVAFTVNPLPTEISGVTHACPGAAELLTDTSDGGVWSSSDAAIANCDSTLGTVTGMASGTVNITYTMPTGCFVSTSFTIDSFPSPISGTLTGCEGSTTVLSDAGAGTWISGSPSIATIDATTGVVASLSVGTATIYYTLLTGCIATGIFTVNPLPVPYLMTGGGEYCIGGVGLDIGLSNSESWVTYQLYRDTSLIEMVFGCSGCAIDWGLRTEAGVYSITATNAATSCSNKMTDSVTIVVNALPTPYSVTGGGSHCLGTSGVHVYLSSSNSGIAYQLFNGVSAIGGSISGTGSSIDFGLQSAAGVYAVAAINTATSCSNKMADSVEIIVNPLPTPYSMTGGGSHCLGDPGVHIYLSGSNSGIVYQLFKGVAAIGSSISGTGSSIDFGLHTTPGNYTVIGTNSITSCSDSMTGTSAISIDTLFPASFSISATPGTHIAAGQNDTLAVIGLSAATTAAYQWMVNWTYITGATSSYYVSSSFADGDSITCLVTVGNECGELTTSHSAIITVSSERVQSNTHSIAPVIFPNPTNDELNITGLPENTNYRLLSVVGNCVKQGIFKSGINTISMKSIIPGIYTLEMICEDGQRDIAKLIKK